MSIGSIGTHLAFVIRPRDRTNYMNTNDSEVMGTPSRFYISMETLTRKWWLYAIIFLLCLIPPWSSGSYHGFAELTQLVKYVAEFLIAKKLVLVPLMPYFHVAMLLLFASLFVWGNRFGRVFSLIAGLHFLWILYMQTGAITDKYGLVFYPNAFILIFLISLGWFWEAIVRRTDFTFKPIPPQRYLIVAAAVFSFWNPDKVGNYSLLQLMTSTSPIAYCMISTIYLAILCVLYPRINLPFFRITSFISIVIGIVTVGIGFSFDDPTIGRHWSLLHTPMVAVSVYCFVLGLKRPNSDELQLSVPAPKKN